MNEKKYTKRARYRTENHVEKNDYNDFSFLKEVLKLTTIEMAYQNRHTMKHESQMLQKITHGQIEFMVNVIDDHNGGDNNNNECVYSK